MHATETRSASEEEWLPPTRWRFGLHSLSLRVTLRTVRIITTARPFSHPFQTVKTDDCG